MSIPLPCHTESQYPDSKQAWDTNCDNWFGTVFLTFVGLVLIVYFVVFFEFVIESRQNVNESIAQRCLAEHFRNI